MKIAIFSKIWPAAIDQLKLDHECSVSINPDLEPKKKLIQNVEVVIVRSPVKLDKETLDAAENLKLIVRAGMGLDTIDVNYAKEKGIRVVIVPLSAESVAEHVLALIFSLYKHIPWYHQSLKMGKWEKHAFFTNDLWRRSLGLVGFGRIGMRIAEIAKVFNMSIFAYDRSPKKPQKLKTAKCLGVRFLNIGELAKVSDIISIQTPLNDDTKNLFNIDIINKMKEKSVIINVGRGGIIDEKALYQALKEKKIAGAALDVFKSEPCTDNPLLTLDNFIGTPHVGAQTIDAQKKIGDDILKIISAFEKNLDFKEYCIEV
ncbi:hydroxyacid dehydrogenase [Candidatus Babeliales bacterium]|nr:hydroxyacid dehydrogenase [Candidatus Babeliales bacterium]